MPLFPFRRSKDEPAPPARSQSFALLRLASPTIAADPNTVDATDKKRSATGLADWQSVLLWYAESVPPLAAAARYYTSAALRVEYRAVSVASGEEATGDVARVVDLMNANRDALSRGVALLFLIGDTRGLFDVDSERLELLSPGELYGRGKSYVRVDAATGKARPIAPTEAAWRSYEPSLLVSTDATSSNKALLDVFEAYRIAYGEERALSIRSAMNAGVTLVSDDVFGAPSTGEFDANGQDGMDPADALETRFQQMLQRTIANPRNSAAFAPPVLVVPGDVTNKIVHVGLAERRDTRMLERRLKALREEIAIGIDLPADVAAGFFADMNHWNGFIVNESAVTNHLAPKIGQVASDAFVEIAASLGIDVADYSIDVDYSDLLLQADMADRAVKAHDRFVISDRALREHLGFTEDDAPSDDNPSSAAGIPSSERETPVAEQEAETDTDGGESASMTAAARTFALEGEEAADALDEINRYMTAARARLQRDIQKEIIHLFNAMRSQRDDDGLAAAAGSDPIQTIVDRIAETIRKAYKTMSLGAARGIGTAAAKSWWERTKAAHDLAAGKAAEHVRTVVANIEKVTPSGSVMPAGKARQLTVSAESVASGKPKTVDANGVANGTRPGIISEQADWLALLNDEFAGNVVVRYTWSHGGAPDPFPPHLDLDGVTWTIDEERDVLNNPDSFPASPVYHPGDHDGCTCEYDADMVVVGGSGE
jgi:hypothetical protein